MNLEPRLLAVASEIKSHTHADIGSDHARLPRYLLETGRIRKAIIVEKNLVPFENATKTLAGLQAKIYLGNGVEPLNEPIHSLSITGMGAKLMVSILEAHPDKLPDKLILQPNDNAEPLRRWGLKKFHLINEQLVKGFWLYEILTFKKEVDRDSSYQDLSQELALHFGPWLIKRKHPLLKAELEQQHQRLSSLHKTSKVKRDLRLVEQALELFNISHLSRDSQ